MVIYEDKSFCKQGPEKGIVNRMHNEIVWASKEFIHGILQQTNDRQLVRSYKGLNETTAGSA